MKSITIDIKHFENAEFPYFVARIDNPKSIWMIKARGDKRGDYKATYLGNDDYYPFQYMTDSFCQSGFKKIGRARVILNFGL